MIFATLSNNQNNRFITIITLLFILISCKQKEDKRLNYFIINELKKNTDTLKFSHFDKVDWNQMYIIPPYSYYKNYDETLLKYQGEIDDYSIYDRDDISVIMLFKEQKLAYKTTVNRSLIFDYAIKFKDNRILSYLKSKANFIIKKEDVIVTVQNGHEYAYKKQGYSYMFKPVAVDSSKLHH